MKKTNEPANPGKAIATKPLVACSLTVDPALKPELPVQSKPVSAEERVTSLTTCGYPQKKDHINSEGEIPGKGCGENQFSHREEWETISMLEHQPG